MARKTKQGRAGIGRVRRVGQSSAIAGSDVSHNRPMPNLSPRMRQTLERLLAGDSEKQIALHLWLSRHTIHVYVKALYRGFGVCSRGELLSRFVQAPDFQSAGPS